MKWPDYHWRLFLECLTLSGWSCIRDPPYNKHNQETSAGLFALSTYIPLRRKNTEVIITRTSFFTKILTALAKQIIVPIFWCHGKQDRRGGQVR